MKSYSTLRNLYGSLTLDTTSANLVFGDQLLNDRYRHICSLKDFYFLHKVRTTTTVASTQFYALPSDIEQVESVFVTISGTRYTPKIVHSREHWDKLNYNTYTSDTPEYAYIYNGQVGLWPTPASAGNTISINGRIRVTDLNTADYTTGTVTAVTNGDETVTFDSTTLTYPMAGRWLRISLDNGTDSGDGVWYEIASITDATHLELHRKYGGTTISAGAQAYIIGQMPLLPETYHDLPVYGAVATYWAMNGNFNKAKYYNAMYDKGLSSLISQHSSPTSDMVLDEGINSGEIINPNLTINL